VSAHGFDANVMAEHGGTTALRLIPCGVRRSIPQSAAIAPSSALVARTETIGPSLGVRLPTLCKVRNPASLRYNGAKREAVRVMSC
jgi:hypothetical protein